MGDHGEEVVTGASIEATLELWASSLREVKARMRPLFSQARVATSENSFLDGLLGDEPQDPVDARRGGRRCGAMVTAGDPGPRTVGCGCPARRRARLCAGAPGR